MTERVGSFQTKDHGELLFVSYDDQGRPFDVVVRETRERRSWMPRDSADRRPRIVTEEYEINHSRAHGAMYHEGSNLMPQADGSVVLHGRCEFWAADGVTFRTTQGEAIGDPEAVEAHALLAPRGDPFENAKESDTAYCRVCDDYYPEHETCRHLYWAENVGIGGPGAEGYTMPKSFQRVVRFLGCARSLLRSIDLGTFYEEDGDHIGGRSFTDRISCLWGATIPEDDMLEGFAWLKSLDAKTKHANGETREWLRAEIRRQNARRASGAADYTVWTGYLLDVHVGEETRHTWPLPWHLALAMARALRASGKHGVRIRYRASKRTRGNT